MGGVTSKVKQELGMSKPTPSPVLNKMINDEVAKMSSSKPATQMAAEDRSARRRARRGGRALLSESRLNPEQGVTTLGQSGMV